MGMYCTLKLHHYANWGNIELFSDCYETDFMIYGGTSVKAEF